MNPRWNLIKEKYKNSAFLQIASNVYDATFAVDIEKMEQFAKNAYSSAKLLESTVNNVEYDINDNDTPIIRTFYYLINVYNLLDNHK